MKTVMVFGTFDIFHPGHLNFLKQAKKYGDWLIVVVARDQNVLKLKKRLPANDQESRLNQIKVSELVDQAILGDADNPFAVIEKYQPAVICLGYDQKVFTDNLKKRFPKIEIYRLKPYRPERYKSSKLLENMKTLKL